MVIEVNDTNFEQTISAGAPVLVDFWAPWCGPCRMLSPLVDEIAEEFEGKITVAKCNVDDCSDVPMNYGIRNIPTLLFFKDGKLAERLVGAVPKKEIVAKVESLI